MTWPCGFHTSKINKGMWNFHKTMLISAELGFGVYLIDFSSILIDIASRTKKVAGKHPREPSPVHMEFVIPEHQARVELLARLKFG